MAGYFFSEIAKVFEIFTFVFISQSTSAFSLPPIPVTSSWDFPSTVSSNLFAQSFSTDARQTARVAQAQSSAPGKLSTFLINNRTCANQGEHLTYRIVVRNEGSGPTEKILVQNQYAAGTAFQNAGGAQPQHVSDQRLLTWEIPALAPGAFAEFTFTQSVQAPGVLQDNLTVTYQPPGQPIQRMLTDHVIPGTCEAATQGAAGAPDPPLLQPRKESTPAIICDPSEVGCRSIFPSFLGFNFQKAVSEPALQPRICGPAKDESQHPERQRCIPNRPDLGVRFKEAIADIVPGECRVLHDDIITTPDYHDALNRRSAVAAFYMRPLYDSGQDFRQLMVKNEIRGIGLLAKVRDQLQKARTDAEIRKVQDDLARDFAKIQEERKKEFDPIAARAVTNATLSILRACRDPSDGGLSLILPDVKRAYEAALDQRIGAFAEAQAQFLARYKTAGFEEAYKESYLQHAAEDRATDDRVRLQNWEVALDTPKTLATSCEKENVFAAPVETTWCESNGYPQFVIQGAPEPEKARRGEIAPPDTSDLDGSRAIIRPDLVAGSSCSGRPGDPWWTANCSCQCNQQVGVVEGRILLCQNLQRITRHDIFVTSREECLADGGKHGDPFL